MKQPHLSLNRHQLGKAMLFAQAASAQTVTSPRLVPWMYMIWPLEQWLTNYRRILDAWEEGGVRGIVIGPLRFWDGEPKFDFTYSRSGAKIQTFAPDPAIYRKHGVDPPENVRLDATKERQLHGLLDEIRERKWELMLF